MVYLFTLSEHIEDLINILSLSAMAIKIICVVGARPNFMKIAPLKRAFDSREEIDSIIVHTGQHYDQKMSDVFFNELEIPVPKYNLGIGGGTHAEQKAKVMLAFEPVLDEEQPDLVLVVGDVNATAACSIVAVKKGIPICHVEAGLRSYDRAMPEEINRMITDCISDYLFVTEQSGIDNLAKEGVDPNKVFFVGNVMIDNLIYLEEKAMRSTILDDLKIEKGSFVLMTMHRPQNVDNAEGLRSILTIIERVSQHKTVVLPLHPRTKNNLIRFELMDTLTAIENVILEEPLGYLQFLKLMKNASMIVTDSGGIQEETTYLQVPCITFRSSTERPVTTRLGTNYLMKELDVDQVYDKVKAILNGDMKEGKIPPFWDGAAAERIADVLVEQ